MDDPLIALGSLLAVALLVLLNILLGGTGRARIASAESAAARYLEDFWTDNVRDIACDADGRAALLALEDPSALGLVAAQGDAFVTRRLTARDIREVTQVSSDTLRLRLDDFSLPEIRLTLVSETAARWRRRIEDLPCRV